MHDYVRIVRPRYIARWDRKASYQHPFGRGHARFPWIDRNGFAQNAGDGLEARFSDVVRIFPRQPRNMQGDPRILGEGLEEFSAEFRVEPPDRSLRERHGPNEKGSARNVDRGPRGRFVHHEIERGVARNAPPLSQGLVQTLAEYDPDILNRVVIIDMTVAFSLYINVDQGMLGQLLQHVVEKTDPGRDFT